MSSFETDPAVLQKAASQIRQTSDDINGELRSLLSQIEPLAGAWKGAASNAFQELISRWQQDAQKLTAALSAIAESMDSSRANYSQSEETNASAISKILSQM
jgi:WXG100 family type VII secretion target